MKFKCKSCKKQIKIGPHYFSYENEGADQSTYEDVELGHEYTCAWYLNDPYSKDGLSKDFDYEKAEREIKAYLEQRRLEWMSREESEWEKQEEAKYNKMYYNE